MFQILIEKLYHFIEIIFAFCIKIKFKLRKNYYVNTIERCSTIAFWAWKEGNENFLNKRSVFVMLVIHLKIISRNLCWIGIESQKKYEWNQIVYITDITDKNVCIIKEIIYLMWNLFWQMHECLRCVLNTICSNCVKCHHFTILYLSWSNSILKF